MNQLIRLIVLGWCSHKYSVFHDLRTLLQQVIS